MWLKDPEVFRLRGVFAGRNGREACLPHRYWLAPWRWDKSQQPTLVSQVSFLLFLSFLFFFFFLVELPSARIRLGMWAVLQELIDAKGALYRWGGSIKLGRYLGLQ